MDELVKSFDFDVFGNLVSSEDELGGIITSDYDAIGNPVSQSGTATYPVRYEYDTLGRMKTLGTRRSGEGWDETQWSRDPATGLVTTKTYADSSTVSYTYTAAGKPLRTTSARGSWRENAYDSRELLVGVSYSDDTPSAEYGYNVLQHLVAASNAVAVYVYANSNLGVATNETVMVGGEVHTLTRKLDDRHRLEATYLDGRIQSAYAYDAEGRLAVVSNSIFSVAYAFSNRGLDVGYTLTLTNGVSLNRALARNGYRHELIRRVDNTVSTGYTNTLVYIYDDAGRRTARNADTFGYNPLSEVTNAILNAIDYTYTYDDIGNHTASSVDSVATTYTANALNQYTAILCAPAPLREPSYDLDGNMLTNGVFSYAWDTENRLTAAYSNGLCIVSNAYDHASRRVTKWTPSHTTIFVYDGWNLIMEIQSSSIPPFPSSTNLYVWGKDLSGSLQGAGGVGGLLAVRQGGAWYFPMSDANGNITAYVDESGSVVAEYAYDAFGGTIAKSGSMADAFAHRFSTKYYDTGTGLYYYGRRFYSPDLHRWLNRDPIEEEGGLNLYAFCGNNGVNACDVNGLDWFGALSDFSAGVADSLTMGATREIRKGLSYAMFGDYDDFYVVHDGLSYVSGETTEIVAEIAISFGGASLRHIAKRTSRSILEGGARASFRRAKRVSGGVIHHINPIKGHPGGRPARFPLPFESAARGSWNMKWVKGSKQHAALHRHMMELETLDRARAATLGIRQAGNRVGVYLDEHRICWETIDITVTSERSFSDYPPVTDPNVSPPFYFLTH